MECRLKDLAAACGGEIVQGDPEYPVRSVGSDSRSVQEGELFVALTGEKFDGHRYILILAEGDVTVNGVNIMFS